MKIRFQASAAAAAVAAASAVLGASKKLKDLEEHLTKPKVNEKNSLDLERKRKNCYVNTTTMLKE